MNIENYIKDLSPELQKKARQCGSIDELLKFAGDEGVELPDEALDLVAGGCGGSTGGKNICINGEQHSWQNTGNRQYFRGLGVLTEYVCSKCKATDWK